MVTDTAGIDDKSFNQSAWEGMQEWGKEHKLPEGPQGYAYIQSNEASDYTSNIDQAISSQFKTIFGIGYLLKCSSRCSGRQPRNEFRSNRRYS